MSGYDKTELAERIKGLIDQQSVRSWALAHGITYTTLQAALRGRNSQIDTIVAIAEAANVSVHWLATGQGPREVDSAWSMPVTEPSNTVAIPRYSVEASAGGGAIVLDEGVVDYLMVSDELLQRIGVPQKSLGIIQARGDSGMPLINDGDLLIISFAIDRSTVEAGGMFVITLGGGLLIKRLQIMMDGSVRVSSPNPAYIPETVTSDEADEALKVHAKVVWKLGPLGA